MIGNNNNPWEEGNDYVDKKSLYNEKGPSP